MPESHYRLRVPVSQQRLWDFHCLSDAVERLTPADAGLRVLRHGHPLALGGETLLSVPFLPGARIAWLARIVEFDPGDGFVDEQIEGPMAFWQHRHQLSADGADASILEDHIVWRLRWWQLPPLSHGLVRRKLDALFAHRHRVISEWCAADGQQSA